MSNINFEKFKGALRKRDEENYKQLQHDLQCVKQFIEKCLKMFCESTANQAQTKYNGLVMH